jgi:hypothetical protein
MVFTLEFTEVFSWFISHHQIRPSIRHKGKTATAIHLVIIYTSHWFRKSQMLTVLKIQHVEMLGVNLKLFLIFSPCFEL